jgi:soluble lytic murein transglycosylase-like protein
LHDLLVKYKGDGPSAIAAYNEGPGAFDRRGGLSNLPAETRKYVNDVMGKMNVIVTINNAPRGITATARIDTGMSLATVR